MKHDAVYKIRDERPRLCANTGPAFIRLGKWLLEPLPILTDNVEFLQGQTDLGNPKLVL